MSDYVEPNAYRVQELVGHRSIVVLDTPDAVDAAWKIGIPATCAPGGLARWQTRYAHQIKDSGVTKTAVIPGVTPVSMAHGFVVGRALQEVGCEVRIVQNVSLVAFFASGQTKADLIAILKATDVLGPVPVAEPPQPKVFTVVGEQRYEMHFRDLGVTFEVNRLRRSSQELLGELLVRVNGHFPEAKTFGDRCLQVGDMNFSSTNMRSTRAKLLSERSGDKSADWYGMLEEFATRVITTERKGKPAEVLAEVVEEAESTESWVVEGFPLLQQLPQVIFGSAAAGKSFLAMWIAGRLAEQGITVLYADWEFSQSEHKKRLRRLFQPMPKNLYYIRCEHSLKHETDHLIGVVQKHGIQYVICDSIGFAVEGPAESQEGAAGYFRSLRQLRIGSLNIAHVPKQYDDAREAQIFGSVYFTNGARSVWFIDRAKENPTGELRFGLFHRKNNVGSLLQPKGFKLLFRGDRTLVEAIDLKDVEELAAGYPLLDRIKGAIAAAPMTVKAIADELGVPQSGINATIGRHKSIFVKMGSKVMIAPSKVTDNAAEF